MFILYFINFDKFILVENMYFLFTGLLKKKVYIITTILQYYIQ